MWGRTTIRPCRKALKTTRPPGTQFDNVFYYVEHTGMAYICINLLNIYIRGKKIEKTGKAFEIRALVPQQIISRG